MELNFPELPENRRWRIKQFIDYKELRIEEKRWWGWKMISRNLIVTDYVSPEFALQQAIKDCLAGRNWRVEVDKSVRRHRESRQRNADNFPNGVY